MRRALVATAYVVLGVAALGLLVLNVLAWTGSLPEDAAPEPSPAPQRAPASEPAPPGPQTISRPPPAAPKRPAAPTLTISATRGDCWVEVRAGSSSGEILYAGTLASGSSLRFKRDKVWLRLGAASNVDVHVNGRPSTVPPGTVELLLPA
jgi:hypothetical protein